VQRIALSMNRPLKPVPPEMAQRTYEQMREGDRESARLHLESVKRIWRATNRTSCTDPGGECSDAASALRTPGAGRGAPLCPAAGRPANAFAARPGRGRAAGMSPTHPAPGARARRL